MNISIFKERSNIEVALLLACIVFVIQYVISTFRNRTEGLQNKAVTLSERYMEEKYKLLKDNAIYDKFYVSIYDSIFSDPVRIRKDVEIVIMETKISSTSSLLDIGSGTGLHVRAFHEHFKDVKGIDRSKDMIYHAKKNYPYIDYQIGNALENTIYSPNSFSHITMFYFTFYFFNDAYGILHNVYEWLKPGGYFIVHLVNRQMFDPIVSPANPLIMVSPQKYAKKRITTSEIKFNDFSYRSEFKLDDTTNSAIFEEVLKHDKTNHIRKHMHHASAPKLKIIIDTAERIGFKINKKVDLTDIEYQYQYLYIMQK